jgi:hypothetical protein
MNEDRYITLDELCDYGLTATDIRRDAPWAVEFTALDGRPTWLREDLAPLLADGRGGGQ